jgi:hypothetical protein
LSRSGIEIGRRRLEDGRMAQRGKPLSGDLAAAVVRVARASGIRACSRLLHVNRSTVQKYVRGTGRQDQTAGTAPTPRERHPEGGASS